MAFIPYNYLNSVVAIGANNRWIGTGFLFGFYYGKDEDNNSLYHLYLVTNKHIFNNFKSVYIRFNPQSEEASTDYTIELMDEFENKYWTCHLDENIDVAVMGIDHNILIEDKMDFDYFKSDENALYLSGLKSIGISEGDFIYLLGFPMNLVQEYRQYVIARNGCIARIRDVLDFRNNYFLIDCAAFPGNSGGPVILKPETNCIEGTQAVPEALIIGMVRSYLTFMDEAISNRTFRTRVVFEENSGLAEVIPMDYVYETILEDLNKRKLMESTE